ncbi:hypothetical protein [Actinotalea sp.]|uniref:hypothetical protein n=1 Tax=Actinotalea sp. TaxID=1872145 RepID=UPI003562DAC6
MSPVAGLVVPGLPAAPETTALVAVPAAAPSPSPSQGELDPNDVSPGLLGFVVVFAIVLLCIPLFRSMSGKIRRIEHRAEAEKAAEAARGDADRSPETP